MDSELYNAAVTGDLSYFDDRNMKNRTVDLQKELTAHNDTALHIATEFHQTEFAKKVVEVCPALVTPANSSGDTALHIAAGEGNEELVTFFINRFDIETGQDQKKNFCRMENNGKDMALHCAARRGKCECAKLLAEADPQVCSFENENKESPLYLLVASGHWKEAWIMIGDKPGSYSSLASHKGPKGLTALHASVLFRLHGGYDILAIDKLVKWRSAMIEEGDILGMTPLHYAAYYDRYDVIESFYQHGAKAIYISNTYGESALHLAAYNGHINTFNKLLDHCPDCYKVVDKKRRTVLHAAVLGGKKEIVELISNTPRLEWLINKVDEDGNTPLHLAVSYNHIPIIKAMINNKKVRYDILNKEFLTPLHIYEKRMTAESLRDLNLGVYLVKKEKGVILMHDHAIQQLEEMRGKVPPTTNETTKKTTPTNDDSQKLDNGKKTNDTKKTRTSTTNNKQINLEDGMKRDLDVNLLVAILVATVTFAAGFAVPGGFKSNGNEEGQATLSDKQAFKVFIVFNSLAFYNSIFVVGFHFISSAVDNDFTRLAYKAHVKPFNTCAIFAMMLAFCCGSYVVLTKSTQLAVLPFIFAAFFVTLLLAYIRNQAIFGYFLKGVATIMHFIHDAFRGIKEIARNLI